jgi:hypothetical protein
MPITTARLNQPIFFPCLFGIGSALMPDSKVSATKYSIKRHIEGNRYLFRNGSTEHFRPHFLIDRTGSYRPIAVVAVRNTWIGFIASWAWDLALSECEVGPQEKLECSKLLEKLDQIKWDRHFRKAGKLRRFLKQKAPDHVFGEKDFREFWDRHCQPLSETEWQQQYPEE